ncbi:MAG: GntR family transcriptional regulator [Betaproteobacteria bacterium]|jgi:GntR family transcriptional regulator|nr:MAG: GntR family transcriptional regulator [Betaproteobacteria bacterium]
MKTQTENGPAYQPLYRQIKYLITESLVSGEWRPGESIPSEVELANRYSVSQGTVRKAVTELADQKLLVRHQGKGTFVASHSEERTKFPFLRIRPDRGDVESLSASLLDVWRIKLDKESAAALGLTEGASGWLIRRLLSPAGEAAAYEEIRLPVSQFEAISESIIEKHDCMLYSMYEAAFGVRILFVEERLKAQQAEGEVASKLSVSAGFPLLVIDRVSYTYGERPVELRRSYCNTAEHHYRNRIL